MIKEDIYNEIAFNIMNLKDSKEMKDKLKNIYTKIDQDVVYSIFQKLFYFFNTTKPKEYKKPIM